MVIVQSQASGSTGASTATRGKSSQSLRAGWSLPQTTDIERAALDSPGHRPGLSFIEHLDALSEGRACQNSKTPYIIGFDHDRKRILVTRANCGQWSCPACAKRQRDTWAVRVFKGVERLSGEGMDNWAFVTLTSNGKLRNFQQTLHVFPDAWAKLSARMRREYGKPAYVLVPERHQNGRLHFHMIVGAAVTWDWLHENAPQCGFGWKVDAGALANPAMCSWYISKYITKEFCTAPYPPKFKRIRTSQGFPALEQESPLKGLIYWRRAGDAYQTSHMLMTWQNRDFVPVWYKTGTIIKLD